MTKNMILCHIIILVLLVYLTHGSIQSEGKRDEEDASGRIRTEKSSLSSMELKYPNDPVFSPTARLLFTIKAPRQSKLDTSQRRSFDYLPEEKVMMTMKEDQNEFEILKVNNKTPAIANYHEFHENLHDESEQINERIKNIKNHDRNFHRAPSIVRLQKNTIQQGASMFEPEKVHHDNLGHPWYGGIQTGADEKKWQKSTSEDRYDRDDHEDDYPHENFDDLEIITGRSTHKRLKSRKRPDATDKTRNKAPLDELKKLNPPGRNNNNKGSSYRNRFKSNYANHDDDNESNEIYESSSEEAPNNAQQIHNQENFINNNNNKHIQWNPVAPNVEFSGSHGYQVNPIIDNNSKLLVPVHVMNPGVLRTNFPTRIMTGAPIVSSSTASPLISSSSTMSPHLIQQAGYSSFVPDVIIGQNSLQNQHAIQAVLLPAGQLNIHDKYISNVKSRPEQQYIITSTIAPRGQGYTQTMNPTIKTGAMFHQSRIKTQQKESGEEEEPQQQQQQKQILFPPSINVPHLGNFNTHLHVDSADKQKKNNNYREDSQILNSNSFSIGQREIEKHAQQQSERELQKFQSTRDNIFENSWRQIQDLHPFNQAYQKNNYAIDNLSSMTTNNNNLNQVNFLDKNQNGLIIKQAQLPVVGMQTVEIRNPNMMNIIKPSPVDHVAVPITPSDGINYFSTGAILTTPIPMMSSTTSSPNLFLTPRPIIMTGGTTAAGSINMQNHVDSLTQIGYHDPSSSNLLGIPRPTTEYKNDLTRDRSTFNPMNLIPNWDLIKIQSILNNQIQIPEPLPKHLNLMPIVPGGNFDKHSPGAQVDLITKPKLSSDLEKYAEEMFKESLRTIYNSQKWNTDKKIKNLTEMDIIQLEKFKKDLGKFQKTMIDLNNQGREILEGHYSENKQKTVEAGTDNRGFMKIDDYLTPPKPNSQSSHGSKYEDKNRPSTKKAPRYENMKPRHHDYHSRPQSFNRQQSPATSNNHLIYSRSRQYHDNYDNYPTFTTSSTTNSYNSEQLKIADYEQEVHDRNHGRDNLHLNHPRIHNLLGLLMKSKQLPRSRANFNIHSDPQVEIL